MRIALDYDGTYTEDPELWDAFIRVAQSFGHEVMIVTMRYPQEAIRHEVPCEIFYTGRLAKRQFMQRLSIEFTVWIDDIPEFILHSTREEAWPDEARALYKCATEECELPLRSKDDTLCVVCERNKGARTEK